MLRIRQITDQKKKVFSKFVKNIGDFIGEFGIIFDIIPLL